MKPLKLPPQSLLLELLDYDPETGVLSWRRRPEHSRCDRSWNTRYAGKPALNSKGAGGYLRGAIGGVFYLSHRVIWKMVTGDDPDQIDHEDGNRQNNRWRNLCSKTRSGNMRNQKRRSNNTSGVTGVFWDSDRGRWRAGIRFNGQTKHLGLFDTIEEAAIARTAAEVRLGFHPKHGRK